MESIPSFLGASVLIFLAGSTIVALLMGGIVVSFISLNNYLKSIHR